MSRVEAGLGVAFWVRRLLHDAEEATAGKHICLCTLACPGLCLLSLQNLPDPLAAPGQARRAA